MYKRSTFLSFRFEHNKYSNHNLPSCKECNKPHSGVVYRGPLENQYAVCAMYWMRLEKESNKKRHRRVV